MLIIIYIMEHMKSIDKLDKNMEEENTLKLKLCKEACDQLGLKLEYIGDDNYLTKVSNDDDFFYTNFDSLPPLNSASIDTISRDKIFTKRILSEEGMNVPRGEYFYVSGLNDWVPKERTKDDAIRYAQSIGYPVFVKPHNQSQGRGAKICKTGIELSDHLDTILQYSHIAMVEEVQIGNEYRVFAIDGVPEFSYRRKAADTSDVANISAGGEIMEYTDTKISESASDLAKKIYEIFGSDLRIFAVDFFADSIDDGIETFTILEVNTRPALTGISKLGHKHKAVEIWTKTLDKYFKKTQ